MTIESQYGVPQEPDWRWEYMDELDRVRGITRRALDGIVGLIHQLDAQRPWQAGPIPADRAALRENITGVARTIGELGDCHSSTEPAPFPTDAAWKAALAALGDNPALCLAEDPSSILRALKAAWAVQFGASPEPSLEPHLAREGNHVSVDALAQFFWRWHTDSGAPLEVRSYMRQLAEWSVANWSHLSAVPTDFKDMNVDGCCDGCGRNTSTISFAPTMDGTEEYRLCATCIHNAARHQELPVGSRPALAGSPDQLLPDTFVERAIQLARMMNDADKMVRLTAFEAQSIRQKYAQRNPVGRVSGDQETKP